MTLAQRAASLDSEGVVALLASHDALSEEVAELKRQLGWFQRQLFGRKSERQVLGSDGRQLMLGEIPATAAAAPTREVQAYRRRMGRSTEAEDDGGFRFDASVPVQVIEAPLPAGVSLETHEVVSEKVTDRLAQFPATYIVLRTIRKVMKRKSDGVMVSTPAPPGVLDRSLADVSLLAGMLVDKFVYHLPLYRQHQRMEAAGIHLARATLTHWAHGSAALLVPIYRAQLASILAGSVITMDETPIRAGTNQQGRMRKGYFWPIYGDRDEVVFPFSPSRGEGMVRETLRGFTGRLVTDGYEVYDRYAKTVNGMVHALSWSHARRHFEHALDASPARCGEALNRIAEIYAHEAQAKTLSPENRQAYRAEHIRGLVEQFFIWLDQAVAEDILLPSHPFMKAAQYARDREAGLKVFLEYPDVPIDTNHLERQIRPIAVGRKNWLFCWTELGAEYVGVLQSLLATCRLHGLRPYTYLVDVLQRLDTHPQSRVEELTPRLWKQHFAQNPLRSVVDRVPRQ